jgi:quinol monooxygenase YgiN
MASWLKVIAMINTTIKLTVPPEKRKEIIQTFKAILGQIRCSEGCLGCNCYVDIEAENNILFIEEWRTREALDSHLQSNHFGVLVGAMKLLTQEPVIRFNTIESTAGAEKLKKV